MKIILNKEEQKRLTTILNSNRMIKQIDFETSEIYINRLANLIVELSNDIFQSYRVGYIYNSKTGKLLFKNDFQKLIDFI